MTATTSSTQPISSVSSPGWVHRHPLVTYFLIAFAGTWAAIIPLVLSAGLRLFTLPDVVSLLLFFFSPYLGPMLAAVIVTRVTQGGAGVRRLLKRIVQWRVGLQWYLAAIFSGLVVWLAAYSLLFNGLPLRTLIADPSLLATVFLPGILTGLLVPSLGEEVGWRGFALPRLQARYGPLLGTLGLGFLHSLWHLPAFFTPFLGPFTPERFAAFMVTGIAGSFLFTWVFNGARGSVLIAILMHSALNAAAQLLSGILPEDLPLPAWVQPLVPDWINVIAFGLAAVLVIILTRGKLAYREEKVDLAQTK